MIAMARIIVFPRSTNFFSFFVLQNRYDELDDFDHNQASSEQERESLRKLIQSSGWKNSTLLPLKLWKV